MLHRFSGLKVCAATALIASFAVPVLAQEAQEAEHRNKTLKNFLPTVAAGVMDFSA